MQESIKRLEGQKYIDPKSVTKATMMRTHAKIYGINISFQNLYGM